MDADIGGYEVELAMNASINALRASMVVAAISKTDPSVGSPLLSRHTRAFARR